ncbi:hypothetical protein V9T40_012203 [Parthenolecanium corni]|uniref:CAF17 C-terminal domain-containing protein n=1 Tax=Parthenolecanium corni TaxID=536013 RepID=A0AAN9T6R7_9HEMI
MLNKFVFRPLPIRRFCHKVSLNVEHLTNRSILKLCGVEVLNFLQGLVTNDIFLLRDRQKSLYTFLLNNKGRILYDALIYKVSNSEILLECDSLVKDDIVRHIRQYCIRKKIEIIPLDTGVWVAFNHNNEDDFSNSNSAFRSSCESLFSVIPEHESERVENNLNFYRDPRLIELGFRIMSPASGDVGKFLIDRDVNVSSAKKYNTHRYKLGVAEGVEELPVGSCIPHETNGDYLNGISFNKGCYLGQELTARVQYTGVVRKRLMPIILSSVPDSGVEKDTPVTSNGKNIGKINVLCEKYGLALMRVVETLENPTDLRVSEIPARSYKPYWWNSSKQEN